MNHTAEDTAGLGCNGIVVQHRNEFDGVYWSRRRCKAQLSYRTDSAVGLKSALLSLVALWTSRIYIVYLGNISRGVVIDPS